MLKVIKCLSFFPLIWIILFSSTVFYGRYLFGHFPIYESDQDLSSLGLEWISFSSLLLLILNVISFIIMGGIFIYYLIQNSFQKNKNLKQGKYYLLLYVLSLLIIIIIRDFYHSTFVWFFD